MNQLLVIVKAKSPITAGGLRPYGMFITTRDYIPGSVLRGAVAVHWLRTNKGLYDRLFKSQEAVLFGNCYPAQERRHACQPDYTLVLPATARTCKHFPGFVSGFKLRVQENPDLADLEMEPHGVFDTLIPQLVYEAMAEEMPVAFDLRCQRANCECSTEPLAGFYERVIQPFGTKPYTYRAVRARMHRLSHSAISRVTRTAKHGLLYSISALSANNQFRGVVTVPAHLNLAQVEQALRIPRLGARVSSGAGEVEINVYRLPLSDPRCTLPPVSARIRAFNDLLTEHWCDYHALAGRPNALPSKPPDTYFVLTLQSDAILRTPAGTPTLEWNVSTLGGEEVQLVRRWVSPRRVSGWNVAWGLPKAVDLACSAGSVFVYKWKGHLPTDETGAEKHPLVQALREIELVGLGERRAEGFGRVLVCDPFHQEVTSV
ncbi:MAG TPA: CRISPR-associated RAMP protein Csx10 [Armatimonadetes bacterium]|nr:CRISPR-associated RAMP protein Csx10 [Armatimonadota bacterium]